MPTVNTQIGKAYVHHGAGTTGPFSTECVPAHERDGIVKIRLGHRWRPLRKGDFKCGMETHPRSGYYVRYGGAYVPVAYVEDVKPVATTFEGSVDATYHVDTLEAMVGDPRLAHWVHETAANFDTTIGIKYRALMQAMDEFKAELLECE